MLARNMARASHRAEKVDGAGLRRFLEEEREASEEAAEEAIVKAIACIGRNGIGRHGASASPPPAEAKNVEAKGGGGGGDDDDDDDDDDEGKGDEYKGRCGGKAEATGEGSGGASGAETSAVQTFTPLQPSAEAKGSPSSCGAGRSEGKAGNADEEVEAGAVASEAKGGGSSGVGGWCASSAHGASGSPGSSGPCSPCAGVAEAKGCGPYEAKGGDDDDDDCGVSAPAGSELGNGGGGGDAAGRSLARGVVNEVRRWAEPLIEVDNVSEGICITIGPLPQLASLDVKVRREGAA